MWPYRTYLKSLSPFFQQATRSESIAVGSVRAGMILKLDEGYVEVKKFQQMREGRGSAMGGIEYVILNSSKIEADIERLKLTVQFVDKDRGVIVAADDNYEQHEIPLKLAAGAESFLEPGTAIGVSMDGSTAVKVALPTNILNQLKKQ